MYSSSSFPLVRQVHVACSCTNTGNRRGLSKRRLQILSDFWARGTRKLHFVVRDFAPPMVLDGHLLLPPVCLDGCAHFAHIYLLFVGWALGEKVTKWPDESAQVVPVHRHLQELSLQFGWDVCMYPMLVDLLISRNAAHRGADPCHHFRWKKGGTRMSVTSILEAVLEFIAEVIGCADML